MGTFALFFCESICIAKLNPDLVLYQVDDLQDKYHECLEMLMENQVKGIN